MSAGSTIRVWAGTYNENVVIDKTLTLIGNGSVDTIVEGGGSGDVIKITESWVNITGFTLKTGGNGIHIQNANYCKIENNLCTLNVKGIEIGGNGNNINNNSLYDNSNCGIASSGFHSNIINNTCNENGEYGIYAGDNYNNIIKNQCEWNVKYGICIGGGEDNIIERNICNSNGQHGIYLRFSSNSNTIGNNTCNFNEDYGISFFDSCKRNIIKNNGCSGNDFGISLDNNCDENIITNNLLIDNNRGLAIHNSQCNYNTIYHNNFKNKDGHDTDQGMNNEWDFGYPIGGNYWSDYEFRYPQATNDSNVWDTPYEIDGSAGAKDNYPLVNPVGNESNNETAANLPDLAITSNNITFSNPKPKAGETITINATVRDVGYSSFGGWNRTFGGSGLDWANSVQLTNDGGYIICGVTRSYGVTEQDIWVIKTDSNGKEIWNNTFGGSKYAYGQSICPTSDDGYIIAGYTGTGSHGNDVLLLKINNMGNEIWSKTFGGELNDYGHSVQQTMDNGYIISGLTRSFGNGENDVYLIKTDSSGNEQWNKTFGGNDSDSGRSVQQTLDGGYIIVGDTWSFSNGKCDIFLIKTDNAGNEQWNKTFGGASFENGYSVRQTTGLGYIIAGYTETYGLGKGDGYIIKTDISGNELWNRTFGGTMLDAAYSVQQTTDDGFIIAGMITPFGAMDRDAYLIKADSSGNIQWT